MKWKINIINRGAKSYLEDMMNTNGDVCNRGAEECANNIMLNTLKQEVVNGTMDRNAVMHL